MIDQETGQVSVQTSNLEDEGTYEVQVRAFIEVPNDYSNSASTTRQAIHTFELSVYVPCKLSELDDLVLDDMYMYILGGP